MVDTAFLLCRGRGPACRDGILLLTCSSSATRAYSDGISFAESSISSYSAFTSTSSLRRAQRSVTVADPADATLFCVRVTKKEREDLEDYTR